MTSDEFMALITAIRELDHHQRKQLSAVLSQQSDGAKVIELIEAYFDTKSSCPHCASAVRVHVFKYGNEQTLYAHPVTVNHTDFLCRVIYPRGIIMKYSMLFNPRATVVKYSLLSVLFIAMPGLTD